MSKVKSLKDIYTLLNDSGDLSTVPEVIEISPKKLNSDELLSLYMMTRVYGRNDKALILDRLPEIEKARHWMFHGEYKMANSHLNPVEKANSDELLEHARKFSFTGIWEKAIEIAAKARSCSNLTVGNLALSYQIEGNALTELRQGFNGLNALRKSQDLYRITGNDYGYFLTTLLCAKNARLTKGNPKIFLDEALHLLLSKKYGYKGWLAYFRTLYMLPEIPNLFTANVLFAASLMATSLGDHFFKTLSLLELLYIMKNDPADILKSSAELSPRHKALILRDSTYQSEVINWLNHSSLNNYNIDLQQEYRFIFFEQEGLIFDLKNQSIHEIDPLSPKAILLKLIMNSDRPLEREEAFTSTWGLRWNPEKHGNLLVTTLSRISKTLPGLLNKRATHIQFNEKGFLICSKDV